MSAYSIRKDEIALSSLVKRAEAGEEVVLSRDGQPVAKIIPFPKNEEPAEALRPYGLKLMDPRWLDVIDEPLDEETQRAFGMID